MTTFIALTLLLSTASPASAVKPDVEVLVPGTWHGEDVSVPPSGRVQGFTRLSCVATGCVLDVRTFAVQQVVDEMLDAPGEETGRSVISQAEVLIRGADLRPGPVPTTFHGRMLMNPGTSVQLRLGEETWRLAATTDDDCSNCPMTRLVVTRDGVDQELVSFSEHATAAPALMWAGDLDRDGQLDLIVDERINYAAANIAVYTSRGPGTVTELGRFYASGC